MSHVANGEVIDEERGGDENQDTVVRFHYYFIQMHGLNMSLWILLEIDKKFHS